MCGEKEFDAESGGIEPHTEVPVRFCGGLAVSVSGPATERIYRFSYENPVQAVDARDAVSIVKTGLFRQVL
jgi:hypothetical protein